MGQLVPNGDNLAPIVIQQLAHGIDVITELPNGQSWV
jgi:hypothetical protein